MKKITIKYFAISPIHGGVHYLNLNFQYSGLISLNKYLVGTTETFLSVKYKSSLPTLMEHLSTIRHDITAYLLGL